MFSRSIALLVLGAGFQAAQGAELAVFDGSVLKIPGVQIGNEVIRDLVLDARVTNNGGLEFSVGQSGAAVPFQSPVVASYEPETGKAVIHTVAAGDQVYTNVELTRQASGTLRLTDFAMPAAIAPASYGNRYSSQWINLDEARSPGLGLVRPGFADARTLLDLDADGNDDLVVAPGNDPDCPTSLEVYRGDGNGNFQYDTQLIGDPLPALCHPRKIITGDFNNDRREDFFVVGHGYDRPPWPGESSWLVLSALDGSYQPQELTSYVGFYHAAAAGDLDNDGDLDIFVTDGLLLENLGGGVFVKNAAASAAIEAGMTYTTEIADVNRDGFMDILVGGHEWGVSTRLYLGRGTIVFDPTTYVVLPPVASWGVVLDFRIEDFDRDGYTDVLLLRTGDGQGDLTFYQGWLLQLVLMGPNAQVRESRIIEASSEEPWINWIEIKDVDDDGDLDVTTDLSYPRLWLNDGAGNFTRRHIPYRCDPYCRPILNF